MGKGSVEGCSGKDIEVKCLRFIGLSFGEPTECAKAELDDEKGARRVGNFHITVLKSIHDIKLSMLTCMQPG